MCDCTVLGHTYDDQPLTILLCPKHKAVDELILWLQLMVQDAISRGSQNMAGIQGSIAAIKKAGG